MVKLLRFYFTYIFTAYFESFVKENESVKGTFQLGEKIACILTKNEEFEHKYKTSWTFNSKIADYENEIVHSSSSEKEIEGNIWNEILNDKFLKNLPISKYRGNSPNEFSIKFQHYSFQEFFFSSFLKSSILTNSIQYGTFIEFTTFFLLN